MFGYRPRLFHLMRWKRAFELLRQRLNYRSPKYWLPSGKQLVVYRSWIWNITDMYSFGRNIKSLRHKVLRMDSMWTLAVVNGLLISARIMKTGKRISKTKRNNTFSVFPQMDIIRTISVAVNLM